jgi:DNA-binding NarL/FixJ family response regulator
MSGPTGPVDIASLPPVELDVARLIAEGFRNREIARLLHRSEKTVEKHVGQIFRKLAPEQLRDRFDRRVLTCRAILASELQPAAIALAASTVVHAVS